MDGCEKISVIIPVYNTEKYIDRCLKSVLSNTYKNIEVVCVDDGSTDSSHMILKKYADEDKRIKVIRQENAGVSAARNRGLDAVTGKFVTFVDSDDWIHPRYFETLLYFQKKTSASVVCCKWKNISDDVELEDFEKDDIKMKVFQGIKEILSSNEAKRIVCGHIYSRELINKYYFESELKNEEDIFFNISLFCKNKNITVAVLDKELYFYYKRLSSATYTSDWKIRISLPKRYLKCSKEVLDDSKEIYMIEACKSILAFRYVSSFSPEYETIKLECSKMIAECRAIMRKTGCMELKLQMLYNLFFKFPFIYRYYRIFGDKTLLDWEKRQKERNNNT